MPGCRGGGRGERGGQCPAPGAAPRSARGVPYPAVVGLLALGRACWGACGIARARSSGVPWSPGFVAPVGLHGGVPVGLLGPGSGAVGAPWTETQRSVGLSGPPACGSRGAPRPGELRGFWWGSWAKGVLGVMGTCAGAAPSRHNHPSWGAGGPRGRRAPLATPGLLGLCTPVAMVKASVSAWVLKFPLPEADPPSV